MLCMLGSHGPHPQPPLFQGHIGPGQVLHHLQVLLQGRTGKTSGAAGAVLQRGRSPHTCGAVRHHVQGSFQGSFSFEHQPSNQEPKQGCPRVEGPQPSEGARAPRAPVALAAQSCCRRCVGTLYCGEVPHHLVHQG